ncbi:MAG: DUF4115 domain-containing protein [Rhodocyclaceae bacterium]|nr:DUF4115 domain-containing protein [Rhodocyclaceae bacterium]
MADDIKLSEEVVESSSISLQESPTELPPEPLLKRPPEPPPPPESPGKKLREERERQGLVVADVAQTLKFSPRQVEAMERNDWNALSGGHAVVRGFLRSYARFLRLDVEPLLALLEPVPLEMGLLCDINEPMPESKRWRLSPFAAFSLFFLLVALVLASWHFLDVSTTIPVVSVSLPSTAQEVLQSVVEATSSTEVEATPSTEVEATRSTKNLPIREFVFKTTDKAWIEAKDAAEQTLLSGDCPADERRVVKSALPVHLVIGNAESVTLTLDGQPFDLTPHSRAGVARFSIQ